MASCAACTCCKQDIELVGPPSTVNTMSRDHSRRTLLADAAAAAVALAASQPSVTRAQQKRKAEMANPEGQPVSAVQQYIDAFNKGDANAMGAMCANPMSILDGMAPHIWHGSTATQDWYKDVL